VSGGPRPQRLRLPALEIRAAEHCNLRCKGCSQNSPMMPMTFPDLKQLGHSIDLLQNVLRAERVTVLGGEPLLNRDLLDLLHTLRDSKMFDRVVVTTNGLLLHRMSPKFWELTDVVEISVYPNTRLSLKKQLPELSDTAFAANTEIHLIASGTFKHIVLSSRIPSDDLVRDLYKACYYKTFTNTLVGDRFYKCAPCVNIGRGVAASDAVQQPIDNGIEIDGSQDMPERLTRYLEDSTPLNACAYCIGSSGSSFTHRQLRARDPDEVPPPFAESLVSDEFWLKRRENEHAS